MADRPSISVALCTWQGARFVGALMQSLLEQSRPPDQVVVVDDCSTDGTVTAMAAALRSPRHVVEVHVNQHRLGLVRNFESAVARCTGDVVALADQDDVWHRDKLAVIEETLAGFPDALGAFSDASLVDDEDRPLGESLWRLAGFDEAERGELLEGRGYRVLARHNPVTGCTLAFRSSCLPLVMPFSADGYHDLWIACLLSAVGDLVPVPRPLVSYRAHAANLVGPARSMGARLARVRRLAGQGWTPAREARMFRQVIERLSGQGSYPVRPEAITAYEAKIRHLEHRAALPRPALRRAVPIGLELLAGGYDRYSPRRLAALYDLVYGSAAPGCSSPDAPGRGSAR